MQTKRVDVLDDISSPAEATLLRVRSRLLSQIVRSAKPYTQAKLATMLDEHQPRVSKLMTGKVAEFSLDRLVLYAQKLGLNPTRVELR